MKNLSIIISVLLAFVMMGCYDPSDTDQVLAVPEIITANPTAITCTTVTFPNDRERRQIRLSATPDFSGETVIENEKYAKTITFTDLKPGTRYYYQYFLSELDMLNQGYFTYHGDDEEILSNRIITGEVKSFVTKAEFSTDWSDSKCVFATENEQTNKPDFKLSYNESDLQIEEAGICLDPEEENLTPDKCMNIEKTENIANKSVKLRSFYSEKYIVGERIFFRPYFKANGDIYYGETSTLYIASGFHDGEPFVDLGLPSGTKWLMKDYGSKDPWQYGSGMTWNNADYYAEEGFKLPSVDNYQELANCQIKTTKVNDDYHYKLSSPHNGAVLYLDSYYRWTCDGYTNSYSKYYYYVALNSNNKITQKSALYNSNYSKFRARYVLSEDRTEKLIEK